MLQADAVNAFHCPRWEELPSIPLYMDQVIIVLQQALAPFADDGERVLTPTMVNNYVKHSQIHPPVKKKYDRRHLAALVAISVMKRVLAIGEIRRVMRMLTDTYADDVAYNLFCSRLEDTLHAAFECCPQPTWQGDTLADRALNAALMGLQGKLAAQYLLGQAAAEEETPKPPEAEEKPKARKKKQ